MKRVVFFIVLASSFCFSQNKGGEAFYSFVLSPPEELKKEERLYKSMEEAIASAENIELSLVFNTKQALFSGGKQIGIPNRDEEIALAFCGCSDDYYVDIDSKTILYNSSEIKMTGQKKGEYLIEKPMETNWILSEESKKINEILCYKATQTITYNNSVKEFTKTVTAWYAPSIPYSFGPNGYGGLPGLILELNDRFVTFGLKSIKFSDNEPKIVFPEKGKKVTHKEYENILMKGVEEIRESMKSQEFNRR